MARAGWLIDKSAYSARTGAEAASLGDRPPLAHMPLEYLTPATAELAGLTVLHVDRDFEIIADFTGPPVERLAA